MRIGIDARVFSSPDYTGIPQSVNEILKVWAKDYPENEYYLLSQKDTYLKFDLPENWHQVVSPWIIDKSILFDLFELPKLIKSNNIDVYWGGNYTIPVFRNHKTRYFVTVYDLATLKYKGIESNKNKHKYNRWKRSVKQSCLHAEKVITISNETKKDVKQELGIEESKVFVSYCGCEHNISTDVVETDVRASLKFDERYFLFIGTIEPRKNILTVIKAYEDYVDRTGDDTKLVLAGKRGWKCDEIYEAIEQSKYRERIIMPGFITDSEKSYLLRNAIAFVFPSLYEGFGLPILEAFNFGTPVLTANVSAMPEVGGDAALYIEDPMDYSSFSALMRKVSELSDEDKVLLQDKMKKQLDQFSWKRNADEMIRIFTSD